MSVRDLAHRLRTGKTSSVELVEEALAKLRQPAVADLNAMISIEADRALGEAVDRDRELAHGMDRGLFHGVPVAYKDLFYTRGVATTAGSPLFREFVPEFDATAVDRLAVAGAVSIGKANLHELAFGATSKNPHFGTVRNPHDPGRITGGSSGGSAALVAAGVVPLALGTDTGGSIRIPASFCGVTGLKPTYGRVSRRGVLPLSFSLDHVGPLGTCVDDCALALATIAGHDPGDPSSAVVPEFTWELPPDNHSVSELTLGLPDRFYFDHVHPAVRRAVEGAVAELVKAGARPRPVTLPDVREANAAQRVIQLAEFASLHSSTRTAEQMGPDVWALLEQGRLVRAADYLNAQRLRTQFRCRFTSLWRLVDVILTPATPLTAPPIEAEQVELEGSLEDVRMAATRFARAVNLLGEPAISLPFGRDENGMPVGVQLIAAPFREDTLLRVAAVLERRAAWWDEVHSIGASRQG